MAGSMKDRVDRLEERMDRVEQVIGRFDDLLGSYSRETQFVPLSLCEMVEGLSEGLLELRRSVEVLTSKVQTLSVDLMSTF